MYAHARWGCVSVTEKKEGDRKTAFPRTRAPRASTFKFRQLKLPRVARAPRAPSREDFALSAPREAPGRFLWIKTPPRDHFFVHFFKNFHYTLGDISVTRYTNGFLSLLRPQKISLQTCRPARCVFRPENRLSDKRRRSQSIARRFTDQKRAKKKFSQTRAPRASTFKFKQLKLPRLGRAPRAPSRENYATRRGKHPCKLKSACVCDVRASKKQRANIFEVGEKIPTAENRRHAKWLT